MASQNNSPSPWALSLRAGQNAGVFHIPGPSTRFHKHEKENQPREPPRDPRPKHPHTSHSSRYSLPLNSPTVHARSSLSRTSSHAGAGAGTGTGPAGAAAAGASSSSSSSAGAGAAASPLLRSTSTRRTSTQSILMAHDGPLTPLHSPHHSAMGNHESPFSDYFTDENRSVDDKSQYTPSTESQRLLLRLNALGAEILRHDPSSSIATDLSAKLDDLEAALQTPSRSSSRLAESCSIADDDEEASPSPQLTPSKPPKDVPSERPVTPSTQPASAPADRVPSAVKARLKNQDRLIKEAQDVLQRVSKANEALRKRYREIRDINESHVLELEEVHQELLRLRSENDSLKSDLGFDHSELLFLKLQLKALEVEADTYTEGLPQGSNATNKRIILNDDIERWKADWDDVDARLRLRRDKHDVVTSTPDKLANVRDTPRADHPGNWRLDLCKKSHGRVQSITIRRTNRDEDCPDQQAEEEEEEGETLVEDLAAIMARPAYSVCATQTDEPVMTRSEWEAIKHLYMNQDEQYEDDGDATDQDEHEDEDENEEQHDRLPAHQRAKASSATKHTPHITDKQSKTAWQELCDSLVAFAGMDRDSD